MTLNRTDLIEHLCDVQHETYDTPDVTWQGLPPEERALRRAAMTCVLEELETLGLATLPS